MQETTLAIRHSEKQPAIPKLGHSRIHPSRQASIQPVSQPIFQQPIHALLHSVFQTSKRSVTTK